MNRYCLLFALLVLMTTMTSTPVLAHTPDRWTAFPGARSGELKSTFSVPKGIYPYQFSLRVGRADRPAYVRVVFRAPTMLTEQKASPMDGRLVFEEWRRKNGRLQLVRQHNATPNIYFGPPVRFCSRAASVCVSSEHFRAEWKHTHVRWTGAQPGMTYRLEASYRSRPGSPVCRLPMISVVAP